MPCLSSASDASTPRSCKRVKKKSLEAGADTLPVAQPCVVYVKALKGFSTFHYRWAYASHADEGMQSGQRCPFKHITETHIYKVAGYKSIKKKTNMTLVLMASFQDNLCKLVPEC